MNTIIDLEDKRRKDKGEFVCYVQRRLLKALGV
jgi:hypothetical protein